MGGSPGGYRVGGTGGGPERTGRDLVVLMGVKR